MVVVNPPTVSDEPFIKRTIGIAGDVISVHDGLVYVNGVQIREPYISGVVTTCDSDLFCDEFVVPEGTIYVMGDNRERIVSIRAHSVRFRSRM